MNHPPSGILISFVIPVYNGIGTLPECMHSLLEQDEAYSYEIILIDDGSSDGTCELIDSYADKYSRVTAIHQANEGQTAARLNGLSKAKGDYVLFADCDDIAEPFAVKKLTEIILRYLPDIVMFTYSEISGSGKKPVLLGVKDDLYEGKKLEEINSRMLLMDKDGKSFPRSLWSKIIRRDLAEAALKSIPSEILTGEDMCTTIGAFLRCCSLYVLDEPLYRYRVSRTSQWRADKEAFRRCLRIVDYLYQCTEDLSAEFKEQYYRLTVQQVYSATQRVLRCSIPKEEFLIEYHSVLDDQKIASAVRLAYFDNIRLKLKQMILRFRMYRPVKLFDKKAV